MLNGALALALALARRGKGREVKQVHGDGEEKRRNIGRGKLTEKRR